MRSRTRRPRPTSSGRPTSPISRSSAGAGFTCRRCSRLLALHPGLEAVHHHEGHRRHRHAATGIDCIRAAIRRASCTSPACSATTAQATSPAISRNGSQIAEWDMFVERLIIPRPRARSSTGVRRLSRTSVTGAKPRANFRAMGFTADSNCASRFAYGRITPHH
jgi:hypothetical protein